MGLVLALVSAMAAASGCAQTRHFQPQVQPDELTDTEFIHYLANVPVVTFGEACRSVLIVADGKDSFHGYAERGAELERRGVIRRAWNLKENDVLDLGTLSYMLAKVCKLPWSVDSAIFGSWGLGDRRYALKQAAYRDIITYGPTYRKVTGGAMVEALANADEYLAKTGAYNLGVQDINAPADVGARRTAP